MKIEIIKDLYKVLHYFEGDEPRTIAQNFCLKNDCDDLMIEKLEKEIIKQINCVYTTNDNDNSLVETNQAEQQNDEENIIGEICDAFGEVQQVRSNF